MKQISPGKVSTGNRGRSQSLFEQLISSSIGKIRQSYPPQELNMFNEQLNEQQPKQIKQLNIDPYVFILEYLFDREELKAFGLKQVNIIIEENYYSKSSLSAIIQFLSKCVERYSTECVSIVLKIKQPSLELFELFFQIYSTILLPQQVAKKFRLLGYQWLIRIFQLKETTIPLYFKLIIDKIGLFEVPQLISQQEEERQLQTYVHKVLNNVLNKVQDRIELQMGADAVISRRQKKGKYLYCFMCQKPADYYCKDTKVPVCSSECKKDHLLYISSVNVVNEQFSHHFKRSVEQMLLKNWYLARSPSLSADYLIAIYIFSSYHPQFQIEHSRIVRSPIMVQKVWLLYSAYYEKKGQMYEHIFISFLLSNNQYLQQVAKYYFLEISHTHRILEIYYNYDFIGNMRLFPLIFHQMISDREYCSIFITNFVEMIFQSISSQQLRVTQGDITLSSTLIELFNEAQSPVQSLEKYFPQKSSFTTDEQISLFLIKNESLIKKQRFTKLLEKDEQFIKAFLKMITIKRAHSRIDELLREIFYFINVNVSEKIYRLLELLYEVYDFDLLGNQTEKKAIKKDDALFQYMYLIIMLNTELHNPNLQKKPILSQVVERIAIINKPLALEEQNKQIISSMYQRLMALPFSQQSRGILKNYQPYPFKMFDLSQFYLPLMILQNYEPIYETFAAHSMPTAIIYRVCNILVGFPEICGVFFKLLLQMLQKQEVEDEYALQAIRNILQEQPNAVNIEGGWKIIFNYIKEMDVKKKRLQRLTTSQTQRFKNLQEFNISPTLPQGEKKRRKIFEPFNIHYRSSISEGGSHAIIWLDLQSVIVASPLLTHDNFIYFFKDFVLTFPIDQYFKQYEKAIHLNRNRLNSMANSLMIGFRKIENEWMGLKMIEFIGGLQQVEMELESSEALELVESRRGQNQGSKMSRIKTQLILLMLKQITITDITECLIVQMIITLSNSLSLTPELWECVTHLALKFKSEENQSIIEELMKRYESCEEYYESLMIQKTLNSTQPELINKDVLTKLDKLEPYLNDLQEKVVRMFVLKENLQVIEKNIEKFSIFSETFTLFKNNFVNLKDVANIEAFLVRKIQQAIQHQIHLQSLLTQQFLDFVVFLFQKRFTNESFTTFMVQYCYYLSLCISATSFDQKTSLDKSVIFYQASKQLYLLVKLLQQKIKENRLKQTLWLVESIHMLTEFCQKLNSNVEYRKTLSQTYTFKHVVQYYHSEIHAPYLVGLNKQFVQCKKLIWIIKVVQDDPSQALDFLNKQISKHLSSYQSISSQVLDFNKSLIQILDQKTVDQIFIKLRQKVLSFRTHLQFGIITIFQFSNNHQIQQNNDKNIGLFWDSCKNLLIKLLFDGVFTIQIRSQASKQADKKTHLPHQTIKTQPLSIYLENFGKESQPIKKLVEKIIKSQV